jgi:hypothetical protein
MKQLTFTLDDATFASAENQARKVGRPLSLIVIDWLKGFSANAATDFDRLAREEEALRLQMQQQGRQFAASDRLTRDELHDRHALR